MFITKRLSLIEPSNYMLISLPEWYVYESGHVGWQQLIGKTLY